MCSTTHASQAPVRLLRRSERLGKPPEGGSPASIPAGRVLGPRDSPGVPPRSSRRRPVASRSLLDPCRGVRGLFTGELRRENSPTFSNLLEILHQELLTARQINLPFPCGLGSSLPLEEVLPLSSDLPMVQDLGHLILHLAINELQRGGGEGDAILTVIRSNIRAKLGTMVHRGRTQLPSPPIQTRQERSPSPPQRVPSMP